MPRSHHQVTVSELAVAIRHVLNDTVDDAAARATAETVMDFFGYDELVPDSMLQPDDRDIFNQLENAGILNMEYSDTHLHTGKEWKLYYWHMIPERVLELKAAAEEAAAHPVEVEATEPDDNGEAEAYAEVPEEAWEH